MPRGGRRNGVPEFMKPHHTHYTQRLNISNVGQSARSFQGNYLSTFPDAGQYRRALCRLRIPRFAFSGSKVSEEARPLPRTNQSQQQRAEAEEQRCGFLPARAGGASRRAPPHCAPSAAARAGVAAAKLGCENESGEAKSASPSTGEPSQQLTTPGEGRQDNGGSSGRRARGARGAPG